MEEGRGSVLLVFLMHSNFKILCSETVCQISVCASPHIIVTFGLFFKLVYDAKFTPVYSPPAQLCFAIFIVMFILLSTLIK